MDGNEFKFVFKARLESDKVFVDAYINNIPQIYNIELCSYEGIYKRRIANNITDTDFFFVPADNNNKNKTITILNIGSEFAFCHGFIEEE